MAVTGTHDGDAPPAAAVFLIASHLQGIGLKLMRMIPANQFQGIEGLALKEQIGERHGHIQAVPVNPMGMAKNRQPATRADLVKGPHAGSQGVAVQVIRQALEAGRQRIHLGKVGFLGETRIDAEAAPKIDHVHRVVGRMHLLAGEQAQIDGQPGESLDSL